ncbi:Uncharacterised protein [Sporosarcina pasteurii]|uniref:Uncharacterized protein n=1 Tax=Sporosarcina pasteurii TaxID=1474 RepID=A0A380C219_SPOPA|nr:Uncharacterised protein [Sporosarcina pasteurii]
MIINDMNLPTLIEIETDLIRTSQQTNSDMFTQLLVGLDLLSKTVIKQAFN